MKKRTIIYALAMTALAVAVLLAQDITGIISSNGSKPALAVVDFRGTGAAQPLMSAFNATLYSDLQNSALFDLRPKSMFPLNNPQQPSDLRPEDASQGYALKDWAGAPVNASHLVFGYTAVTNGVLGLYGYVYDTRQQSIQSAQLFAKTYAGSPDEAGAIYLAHQFATDIITKFGGSGSEAAHASGWTTRISGDFARWLAYRRHLLAWRERTARHRNDQQPNWPHNSLLQPERGVRERFRELFARWNKGVLFVIRFRRRADFHGCHRRPGIQPTHQHARQSQRAEGESKESRFVAVCSGLPQRADL
jgi:hypothetical protein